MDLLWPHTHTSRFTLTRCFNVSKLLFQLLFTLSSSLLFSSQTNLPQVPQVPPPLTIRVSSNKTSATLHTYTTHVHTQKRKLKTNIRYLIHCIPPMAPKNSVTTLASANRKVQPGRARECDCLVSVPPWEVSRKSSFFLLVSCGGHSLTWLTWV